MRELIDKGKALAATVWILSVISTNAEPKLWQVGLVGILMYETILLFIKTWRRATRKQVRRKNISAGREDMKRVEDQTFVWKMKEVV